MNFKYYCGIGHSLIGFNSEGWCPMCNFIHNLESVIKNERSLLVNKTNVDTILKTAKRRKTVSKAVNVKNQNKTISRNSNSSKFF